MKSNLIAGLVILLSMVFLFGMIHTGHKIAHPDCNSSITKGAEDHIH